MRRLHHGLGELTWLQTDDGLYVAVTHGGMFALSWGDGLFYRPDRQGD